MRLPRLLLGLLVLWEIVRFYLLFTLLKPVVLGAGIAPYTLLLWFGAPGLVVGAGLAAAAAFPRRYGSAVTLAILGKIIVLPLGVGCVVSGRCVETGFVVGFASFLLSLAPLVIVAVDLVTLPVLLWFRRSTPPGEES